VLPEIIGVEDPAVFGCGHVEAVLAPKRRDRLFQSAGLAAGILHYIVFETGRLGEDEDGFLPRCE